MLHLVEMEEHVLHLAKPTLVYVLYHTRERTVKLVIIPSWLNIIHQTMKICILVHNGGCKPKAHYTILLLSIFWRKNAFALDMEIWNWSSTYLKFWIMKYITIIGILVNLRFLIGVEVEISINSWMVTQLKWRPYDSIPILVLLLQVSLHSPDMCIVLKPMGPMCGVLRKCSVWDYFVCLCFVLSVCFSGPCDTAPCQNMSLILIFPTFLFSVCASASPLWVAFLYNPLWIYFTCDSFWPMRYYAM